MGVEWSLPSRLLGGVGFAMLCGGVLSLWNCGEGPRKTDVDRIVDVHSIAQLAEDFAGAKGHFPLAERTDGDPVMVHLSMHPLPTEYRRSVAGPVLQAWEFEAYLTEQLERQVEVPLDDRMIPREPGALPMLYVYFTDGTDYWVSALLEAENAETRRVVRGYYKYEVGSRAVPERGIKRYEPFAGVDD